MKHDKLKSIAHNIADSLASGIGLLIGVYEMDIFGEAAKNKQGYITVDFLKGTTSGGRPSRALAKAIKLYSKALPDLCARHGFSVSCFHSLAARYYTDGLDRHVLITIEDKNGRQSNDEYIGSPLKRVRTLDSLGRIRTKRK